MGDLIRQSDVVVVGVAMEVTRLGEMVIPGTAIRAERSAAQVRVDHTLKGASLPQTIQVRFAIPLRPVGYRGVVLSEHTAYFLVRRGDGYEFTSPYSPGVMVQPEAMIQSEPMGQEGDIESRVIAGVFAVVESPAARLDDRLKAVTTLSTSQLPAAAVALKRACKENDRLVQLRAAAALLRKNDLDGMPVAVDALTHPPTYLPQDALLNVAYSIAGGVSHPKAIPQLRTLCDSPWPVVRRSAVVALTHTHSEAAIPALLYALEDDSRDVRFQAVTGLSLIVGRPDWRSDEKSFQVREKDYLDYWRQWAKARE